MLAVGAGCWAGRRTCRSAAVATLGVALLGSCGGPDAVVAPTTSPVPSTTTSPPSTTATVRPTTIGTAADAVPTSTGTTVATTVATTVLAASPIEFAELIAGTAELAGQSVAVHARAFFLEQCPPPTTGQPTSCSLSLFVTEPERDHLLYADRTDAIPVFDAHGRVTCHVGSGVTTACPGWVHGARYELTGTVTPVAGDPGLELHITDFRLVDDGSG